MSVSGSTWEVGPGGPLRGSVQVPGDKSISHRSLLFSALADGPCRVQGLLDSGDVRASAGAIEALGARVEPDGDGLVIRPPSALSEPRDVIDCGNSGTTMRLLAGLVAAESMHVVLTGDSSLRSRPMMRIARPIRDLGAHVDGREEGGRAPLAIRGPVSRSGSLELPVASAQVKSCVLLAGRRVGVHVREPMRDGIGSRDHTERLFRRMDAPLVQDEAGWWHLAPFEHLRALDITVPGDPSSAAFLLVAASLLPGSEVVLRGVGVNPTRTGILDALAAMGADVDVEMHPPAGPHAEPVADLVVRGGGLKGCRIAGTLALRALDELPVLAVAAAFAEGTTTIADASELRVKESDRIARTAAGLRALGVEVEERPDGMVITGREPRPGGEPVDIDATGDHRIAMAFAVAGLVSGPVRLHGADVSTSYPSFQAHLEALRGA